jgi:signal transduction histidine kinase
LRTPERSRAEPRGSERPAHALEAPAVSAPSDPDVARELHLAEVTRARVFFRAVVVVVVLLTLALPLLPGAVWLRGLTAALGAAVVCLCVATLLVIREPERYTARLVTAVGVASSALGVAVTYYLGLFSGATLLLGVGIYFFALSRSARAARTVYATFASLYLVATASIAAGVVPDLSMFSSATLSGAALWYRVVMSQVVFAMIFYLARSSRRAASGAIERVHEAHRELRRREAQLAEANRELAERERQAAIAEADRRRHRAIAEMVTGVAHELNTPLGIVQTAASVLAESLGDATDTREAARLIESNLGRASRLLQAFKHLSASQLSDARETVDLGGLIGEIVTVYLPTARARGLELVVEDRLPREAPRWTGPTGQLAQVVLNLLANAERYAYPEGSRGRVIVSLLLAGESFELVVEDHGAGIAPAHLPRIFDAFFTTGRDRGGTGLGLSIVRAIVVESMGGTIAVESQPDEGARFIVRFPLVAPERPVEGTPS